MKGEGRRGGRKEGEEGEVNAGEGGRGRRAGQKIVHFGAVLLVVFLGYQCPQWSCHFLVLALEIFLLGFFGSCTVALFVLGGCQVSQWTCHF